MAISKYFKTLREKIGTMLLQVPGVAAVIHDETGKILLQKAINNPVWSLPAGAIEPGESPAEAMVREVWEETGLKVRPYRILGIFSGSNGFRYTYPNGDQVEYTCVVFECKVVAGKLSGQDDETAELQYFELEQMPELAIEYPKSILKPNTTDTYFEWDEKWLEMKISDEES